MTNPKIITLQEKKDELNKILENYSQWSQVEIWIAGTAPIMREYFPNHLEQFTEYCKQPEQYIMLHVVGYASPLPNAAEIRAKEESTENEENLKRGRASIKRIVNFLEALIDLSDSINLPSDTLTILERIFSRFHRINLQFQNRYSNRPTIQINDEYDVQDLLHSLLHLYFADIRSEVDLPEFAGKNSRIDFVLKQERIMIEVKKTSQTLKDKQLGSQLIDDIPRYKQYQDASNLVFFIYDPDTLMSNPQGIIDDIETHSNKDFPVKVFIYPRH
jgi:hypothetical protein